jgi:hypothetical protein
MIDKVPILTACNIEYNSFIATIVQGYNTIWDRAEVGNCS